MNLAVVAGLDLGQAARAACLLALLLPGCRHGVPPEAPDRPRGGAAAGPLSLRETGAGLPVTGQWRNGFDLADVDGDGRLDLVHPPPRKGQRAPVVLLGDGTGGFERMRGLTLPGLPFDYGDVAAADLDGDGRPDLALAIHLRGLVALRNLGGGRFEDMSAGLPLGPPGQGFTSRSVETADWDGDGRVDLVAFAESPARRGGLGATEAAGLRVFLNRGDHWQTVAPPARDPAFGDSLAVADVDGDGRPDAVTSAGGADGRAILHLNRGSSWLDVEIAELLPKASVTAVAAGDVDADGDTDLVIGYLDSEGGAWHSGIDLMVSGGAGFDRHELIREPGRNHVRALAVAELDGDRRLEVVALRGDGLLQVFAGGSPGPTAVAPVPEWRKGCSGYGLRLGDLDRDGRLEIVATFAGESSAYDIDGGCRSGGGIQAWAVGLTGE